MSNAKESLLQNVKVASPCTAAWETMEGGEVVRFCSQCQLNVYNLSAMPRETAEKFVRDNAPGTGRTCIRFYKRHDGTFITSDCPVGVAALKAKAKRAIVGVVTVAASLFFGLLAGCGRLFSDAPRGATQSARQPGSQGGSGTSAGNAVVMGDMCLPLVPSATSGGGNDLEISLATEPETPREKAAN